MAKGVPVNLNITALDRASGPLKKVQASVGNLGKEVGRVEAAFKGVDIAQRKLGASLEKTGKKIRGFGTAWSLGVTAPITAGATVGIMELAKQEDAFIGLKAEMDKASFGAGNFEAGFLGVQKALTAMSLESAFPVQELVAAFDDAVDSTGNATDGMLRLRAAADLAGAQHVGLVETQKTLNSVMSSFRIPADQAAFAAGQLNKIMQDSGLTMEAMGLTLAKIAPQASEMGVGMDQIGAILQVAKLSGIEAADAMAGIEAIMSQMGKKTSPRMAAEAKRLGIAFGSNTLVSKGLVGVIQELDQAQGANRKSAELLFKGAPAQILIKKILAGKTQALTDAMKALRSEELLSANVTAALAERHKSLNHAGAATLNTFKIMMAQVFEPLKPTLIKLADSFGSLAKFFQEHPAMARTVGIFALFLAALGPIVVILGQLIFSIGQIVIVFSKWGLIVQSLGRGVQFVTTALTGFWGILVRIGAALIAPIAALQTMATAIVSLGVLFTGAVIVAGIFAWVSAIKTLWTRWSEVSQIIKDVFSTVFGGIAEFLASITMGVDGVSRWTTAWGGLASVLSSVWSVLRAIVGTATEAVKIIGDVTGISSFFGGSENTAAPSSAPASIPNDAASRVAENNQRNVSTTNNASVSVDLRNLPKGSKVSSEGGEGPFKLSLGFAGQF